MRRVTVTVPAGRAAEVIRTAVSSGVRTATVTAGRGGHAGSEGGQDIVQFDTATPVAQRLVERLLQDPAFEPGICEIAVVHPRTVVGAHGVREETRPVWVPALDIYQDLWQFTHVTWSLVGRTFLAALLLAYGMIERNLPVMIAALLFLPYHHQMLAMALGARAGEWRLALQGLLAWGLCTALIVLAGAAVAAIVESPLRYDDFGTLKTGVLIAALIGVAAALASADDAGRRELIGLAATAHITILPAWLGIMLVFGLPEAATTFERLITFAASVITLVLAAGLTYAIVVRPTGGLRRYAATKPASGGG